VSQRCRSARPALSVELHQHRLGGRGWGVGGATRLTGDVFGVDVVGDIGLRVGDMVGDAGSAMRSLMWSGSTEPR
jgi:hypothetical protein